MSSGSALCSYLADIQEPATPLAPPPLPEGRRCLFGEDPLQILLYVWCGPILIGVGGDSGRVAWHLAMREVKCIWLCSRIWSAIGLTGTRGGPVQWEGINIAPTLGIHTYLIEDLARAMP